MNRSLARIAPRFAAAATAAIATCALAGWIFDAPTLKSIFPREAPIEPNAALALLAASIALYGTSVMPASRRRYAQWLSAGVVAIGLATLAQYVFNADLGIDEALFRDTTALPGAAPGRMSPYSAVALVGIGIAVAVFNAPSLRPLMWASAALTAFVGAVQIVGYLWDAPGVLGNRWVSALASTIAFVLLGAGALIASTGEAAIADRAVPRTSVERKVRAAFVGALVLLFVGAGFTYRSSIDFTESLEAIARTEQLRDALVNLPLALAGAEAAQTAYLLTSRQQQRDEYERLAASANAYRQSISAALARDVEQAAALAELKAHVERRLALLSEVTTLFDETGLSSAREAVASEEGMHRMRAIRDITERMDERGERLLLQRETTLGRSRQLTLGSLVLTLALAAGIFLTLFRGISREMRARAATENALRERNAEVSALNSALARRAAEAEAANRELEAFSYSVSHDLRAPLRHVDGYLEMLLDENGNELSESARRKVDVIGDSSRRMGTLIEDLLAFSRMGRAELHVGRVDLDALVRQVVSDMELETRGRTIDWRIGPLPAVIGDGSMLRQVFSNLVSNALKYSRNRPDARIDIAAAGEENGRAIVFVRDNGVGFDMAHAGRLFGIFQRLHRAQDFEGTGIGLANVQRVIIRHGGRVWAESAPGRGATFYLTLELHGKAIGAPAPVAPSG